MRATPLALVLGVLLAVAGCSGDPGPEAPPTDAAATEEPPDEHTYAPGLQITVELTMNGSGDGGRSTPFFSGYRPTIGFEHRDQSAECSAQLPVELREFPPGETHMIGLECDTEVTVHVDAPGFTLSEDGAELGSGEVIFTGEE